MPAPSLLARRQYDAATDGDHRCSLHHIIEHLAHRILKILSSRQRLSRLYTDLPNVGSRQQPAAECGTSWRDIERGEMWKLLTLENLLTVTGYR